MKTPVAQSMTMACKKEKKAIKAMRHLFHHAFPNIRLRSVEMDASYQKKGIDFNVIVKGKKGMFSIEVKADSYVKPYVFPKVPGNIVLERMSNTNKMTPGWTIYSQADRLLYYYIQTGTFYIFNMEAVKEWFRLNKRRTRPSKATTRSDNSNENYYDTLINLFPVDELMSELGGTVCSFKKDKWLIEKVKGFPVKGGL